MKPLSRRLYAIAAIVLAAVIFVAINIAANAYFISARIDLTQTQRFTLSRGTKNIISELQEPITLKFFYSKKIAADYAQINAYAGRVRDLLRSYAARSDGKIILQEVDPEPYTPAEDEATSNGLTGAPTDNGDLVYFGLVGSNTIDGKQSIAFFSAEREAYLEYDLTSLIYKLSHPKKPKVAIISSLPLDTGNGGMQAMVQGQAQPMLIYSELSQTYDTQMLDPQFTSIPADADVLMIVHPPALNQQQTYAIDQFVLKGGRALVFVDPNSEIAASSGGGMMGGGGGPTSSTLPRLFQAWGVAYNPGKVLADRDLAQQVQTSNDPRNPTARYPVWLHLTNDDFDSSDQVTANLQTLNLASAGAISPMKDATTHFAPLVSSSKEASLLDSEQVRNDQRPQDLMNAIQPVGSPYSIAARITGSAHTAFPGGPPSPTNAPEVKSAKSINVIIMADSDIFDDRFWVRTQNLYGKQLSAPFADNAAFVLNALENLMGSNDLISLRTRATDDRPFTVVKDIQAKAQAQFKQEADGLQQKMTDTQQSLHALEQGQGAGGQNSTTLTAVQQAEIERFKRDLIDTRAQLRDVQHRLRAEIDRLGSILAFINIALVPILVSLFAVGLALVRRRRRARAIAV
ncbi:MAG TPA: Gldg family protein [Rhizomicrobium sp.]|nr:Gldg family protein [Rhizomicrobium sp.]